MISKKRLREFWTRHADAEGALKVWHSAARRARWNSLVEVQQTYPHAESVGPYTVFNIKGNAYRLVTKIKYSAGIIFVRDVLTHAEYDKGYWK